MGNENKIDKNVHDGVQLFLKEVHPHGHEVKPLYDLNSEYAKTRQNKSVRLWLPLIICVAIVLVSSAVIFFFVNRTNERITVSVDAFEDLNLSTLLDTVSETRSKRDSAYKEADSLRSDLQTALDRASRDREAELFTINSLNLSSREKNARIDEAQKTYDEAVDLAHEAYDSLIVQKETEAERYQKQLAEYDSERLSLAREKENAINSQRQVFEMEKEQLVSSYEANIALLKSQISSVQDENLNRQIKAVNDVTQKYQAEINALDPVIADREGNAIVSRTTRTEVSERFAPFLFTSNLSAEASEDFKQSLALAESLFNDFDYTQKIISSVPQKNSIPSFVRTSSRLSHSAGNELVRASTKEVNRLSEVLQSQRREIDALTQDKNAYQETLLLFAEAYSADGLVLKVLSSGKVSVLLSSSQKQKLKADLSVAQKAAADLSSDEDDDGKPTEVQFPMVRIYNQQRSVNVTLTVTNAEDFNDSLTLTLSGTSLSSLSQGLFVTLVEP